MDDGDLLISHQQSAIIGINICLWCERSDEQKERALKPCLSPALVTSTPVTALLGTLLHIVQVAATLVPRGISCPPLSAPMTPNATCQ